MLVGGGGPLQVAAAACTGIRITVDKATSRPSAEHSKTSEPAEPVSLAVFAAIFAFFAVVALVDIMVVARRRLRGEARLSHGPAAR